MGFPLLALLGTIGKGALVAGKAVGSTALAAGKFAGSKALAFGKFAGKKAIEFGKETGKDFAKNILPEQATGAMDMGKGFMKGDMKAAAQGMGALMGNKPQSQPIAQQPAQSVGTTENPTPAYGDLQGTNYQTSAPPAMGQGLSQNQNMRGIPPEILAELYRRRGMAQI
jgi:hypothetical protein